MKKFLALALTLAMVSSMLTISGSAAGNYADASDITYREAVDVLSAIGVLEGDSDGFRPEDTLKRSEAAKIICALNLTPRTAASLAADSAPFGDVPVSHWASGYIAEGVQSGILAGMGENRFSPDGQLTGFQYLKMLLVSLGYDAKAEGLVGANWTVNVAKLAKKAGLTAGNDGFVGTRPVTREEAALYALNTLKAERVEYATLGTDIVVNGAVISTGASAAESTGEAYMKENYAKLRETSGSDRFGRPAAEWSWQGEEIGIYPARPILTVTEAMDEEDVIDALEDEGYDEKHFEVDVTATENGTLVEFYGEEKEDEKGRVYNAVTKVVTVETFAAKVGSITKDRTDDGEDERAIDLGSYGTIAADSDVTEDSVEVENFDQLYKKLSRGDIVLVTMDAKDEIAAVTIPEAVEGKVNRAPSAKSPKVTVDGEVYSLSANNIGEYPVKSSLTVYLDAYGYAIASGEIVSETSDVVYLADIYKTTDKYGSDSWFAQLITAGGEVEELPLAEEFKDAETGKAYIYTTNSDGELELEKAADALTLPAGGEIGDGSYIRLDGKRYYFAEELTMVYISGSGAKLTVSVSDALEKVAEIPANSFAVVNEDREIITLFIADEASGFVTSGDLVYIADNTVLAEDEHGSVIEAYVDGKLTEIVVDKNYAIGFYSASVNDDAVYALTAVKSTAIAVVEEIFRNKYVTLAGQEADFILDEDAAVIDLSGNSIRDLADLSEAMEEQENLRATAVFDAGEERITMLVIETVEE